MEGGGHLILVPPTHSGNQIYERFSALEARAVQNIELASQRFPALFSEYFSSFPGAQGTVSSLPTSGPLHLSKPTLFQALSSELSPQH